MRCPVCKRSDEVQRCHRGPVVAAIDPANPFEPYLCNRCWRVFWRPKEFMKAFIAACLGGFLLFLIINAGLQLYLLSGCHVHRTADRSKLFLKLDPDLKCRRCQSRNISRSTLQPPDRIVSWLNPFTPYRCWDCWRRFWRLKTPFEALTNTLLLVIVLYFVISAILRYRERKRAARRKKQIQV